MRESAIESSMDVHCNRCVCNKDGCNCASIVASSKLHGFVAVVVVAVYLGLTQNEAFYAIHIINITWNFTTHTLITVEQERLHLENNSNTYENTSAHEKHLRIRNANLLQLRRSKNERRLLFNHCCQSGIFLDRSGMFFFLS